MSVQISAIGDVKPNSVESDVEKKYDKLEMAIMEGDDKEDDKEDDSMKKKDKTQPIDKSFDAYNPFQWLKWTFPHILFTVLMFAETADVISDCLQLQEVVVKFNKYSAPPFVKAGTLEKRYTVIWEKVDRVGTNESMLGYKLEPPWNGNPSGVPDPDIVKSGSSFLELDCLANGQIQGDGHLLHSTELKADVRGSDYKSEEVCIS